MLADDNLKMLFDHENDSNEKENIAEDNPKVIDELMPLLKKMNNGYLPDLK